MENEPDDFDHATQCGFWMIRHLRNHRMKINPDSADALACNMILTDMTKILAFMSPSEGDWPAEKDGFGKVLTFIPRQRA